MKLVNNVVAAATRQVTFEALALGVKNGLDFKTCVEVLSKGSGCNYTLTNTMPLFMQDPARLSFTMALMLKDVRLATQLGRDTGVPMPMCGLAHETLLAGVATEGPGVDNMHLLKRYERAAGVRIVNDARW
jgi:3-hydroxyisobutyrate dehydrogenase